MSSKYVGTAWSFQMLAGSNPTAIRQAAGAAYAANQNISKKAGIEVFAKLNGGD